MEEIMKQFVEYPSDPYTSIAKWKENTKKKVIGIFPMWIPEEIIHAAGMLPVVMWRSNEAITWGYAHVPPYNCAINKSVVDDAVKGKLKFMDGMVFLRQCLQSQEVPFIVENNRPPAFEEYLYLPPIYHGDKASKDFTRDEFKRLRKRLEEFGGEKITDEKLNESIKLYNKNRSLLRKLYDLRKENPGILRGRDVLRIVWSSMLMPKEEHNKLLESLLSEMEKNGYKTAKGKKVFLSGCLCIHPQLELLDMIEDLGMLVVDDDIYVGYRYFANDAEITDDPIGALMERHFIKTPVDPARGEVEVNWGKELIGKVKKLNADGIITLLTKYCPPHLCYYPDIKVELANAGIPEVLIEVEHEVISLESIKTRLQSFREMIGGR
ncbi:MAG: benzoyl-CoA reductase subunit [bacterium]|nr:MAG: benzoyl-CoA reductase subunit [bacterium]